MQEEEARGSDNLKYKCRCSFLEIYNEQVADLLEPSSSNLQVNFSLTFLPVLWPTMLFGSLFMFYRLEMQWHLCCISNSTVKDPQIPAYSWASKIIPPLIW